MKIVDVADKAKTEGSYFFDLDVLNRVTPEIKELVEGTFPVEFYGEDILIYEAWSLRGILYSAMQLAVEQKLKQIENKLNGPRL